MIKLFRANASSALLTGSVTLNITVPGTYGGISPIQPTFQGRQINKIELFFAAPLMGDIITSFSVSDANSLIPVPLQSQFPSYPILKTWDDSAAPGGNQGIYLYPEKLVVQPLTTVVSVPSGMVLTIVGRKASPLVDILFVNIYWDDFN